MEKTLGALRIANAPRLRAGMARGRLGGGFDRPEAKQYFKQVAWVKPGILPAQDKMMKRRGSRLALDRAAELDTV